MRKHIAIVLSLLGICTAMQAQPPHNQVGYDTSNNTLTTVHYGYGNKVEQIIYFGQDQTTISVNNVGMPTEITNSLATVSFSYAGTSAVTVTQTVNGQTKTDRLSIDSPKVINYRAEFNKFNQDLFTVGKIDYFLAGGGAKMIGGVVDALTDKLENPIGACFSEALEAAKKTDNPIIPISTLDAMSKMTNLTFNPLDIMQNMLTSAVFENYTDWTQEVSDFVYKYQMEQYHKQKADNRMENEWRVSIAATLLANGKTQEEAARAIARDAQRRSGAQTSKPAPGKPNGKGDTQAKNDGDKGNKGGNEKPEDDDDDDKLPDFEKPEGIISYVKMLANEKHSGLPHTINVQYNRYSLWDPLAYNIKLNADKKTYTVEDYSKYAGDAQPLGDVLEKPFVHLIIWWGAKSEEKRIPIAKPVDNRKYKY